MPFLDDPRMAEPPRTATAIARRRVPGEDRAGERGRPGGAPGGLVARARPVKIITAFGVSLGGAP